VKAFTLAIVSLSVAAPAFAQGSVGLDRGADRTSSDARRTGDTNEQGERLICRSVNTSSTSRMATRRVCRTAAEWREISRQSQD
jgi:hypothetical protein